MKIPGRFFSSLGFVRKCLAEQNFALYFQLAKRAHVLIILLGSQNTMGRLNTERDKYEQLLIIEKTSHLEKSIDSGAIIKKKAKGDSG